MYEADIEIIKGQIKLMKDYLLHKLDIGDLHGVYDCAIDLRCLTEKLEWMQKHDVTIAATSQPIPLR